MGGVRLRAGARGGEDYGHCGDLRPWSREHSTKMAEKIHIFFLPHN